MSLINEALKRTRDLSFQPSHVASVSYRPPQDIPHRSTDRPRRRALVGAALIVLVAGSFAVAAQLYLARQRASLLKRAVVGAPPLDTVPAPTPFNHHASTIESQPAEADIMPATEPSPKAAATSATASNPPPPNEPSALPLPPAPVREPPRLVLQGIMRGPSYAEAMINGLVYRVGDDVEGAQIVAIEPALVRLNFEGREIRLRLR